MANAGNDSAKRFYVPEVHDIFPGMERELEAMLDVWPSGAREKLALLVVPDWQGRFPLAASPDFVKRISRLAGEKVLHGFTHSLGPEFWNWLLYGHDNRSEFGKLDEKEARERIARGLKSFEDNLGIGPRWFCAPRWHQSAAATKALREAGFEGYMLRSSLRHFSGASVDLPALCFDEGDRRLRSAIARHLRELSIRRLFAAGHPFRITLHPSDVTDATAWSQVKRVMQRLSDEGWTPIALDEAMARFGEVRAVNPVTAVTVQ
ncbi:MAG: hypothetical protein Rhirs2KO_14040 [Rhizobiaceae bacterium]